MEGKVAKKILRDLSSYTIESIEAALIQSILLSNNVEDVKNLEVLDVLKNVNSDTKNILNWISSNDINPDLKLLEKFYELQKSPSDKKTDGAYFTPTYIIKHIIDQIITKVGTVCDPSCGSGAFLLESSIKIKSISNLSYSQIYSKYIYGVDILESNLRKTRLILSLNAILNGEDKKEFNLNLHHGDSLSINWDSIVPSKSGFHFVVGNPPYVRTKNLRQEIRRSISLWETGNFGNVDLYIPFFELAIQITNKSGLVGYITPNTYISALNATRLREYLSENNYLRSILDFNGLQIFDGVTTYTCITILDKNKKTKDVLFEIVHSDSMLNELDQIQLKKLPHECLKNEGWKLLSKIELLNIQRIENVGTPLLNFADRYITGLATLNNNLYLIDGKKSEGQFIIKSSNGKEFRIEKGLTKKIIKPNKIKDQESLSKNTERIIFPYEILDGKYVLMSEAKIKSEFPSAYSYLLSIKRELSLRDKGKRVYKNWYAYGRTQGLDGFGRKIVLPMMNNRASSVLVDDPSTLFYCGYAIYSDDMERLQLLNKVLSSKLMWYYISKTSKNYSGGFKSFAKNYVKNFSIPEFTDAEKRKLLTMKKQADVDNFLIQKYQLTEV